MKKVKKWKICDGCNIVCTVPLVYLKKDIRRLPEGHKCSRILRAEKEDWIKRSSERSKKCEKCGLVCHNPRLKSGKGGEDCKKLSKKEKIDQKLVLILEDKNITPLGENLLKLARDIEETPGELIFV